MKRLGAIFALIMAAVISSASAASAVDFPPEILFDQYLLEAKRALEDTTRRNRKINRRKAAEAFKRIEGLNLELSLEFRFFYGKFLASADPSESVQLAKGMSLLKQYVLEAGRNAEHYADALELLSTDKMKGALMTACFHGHTEAVKILLSEGMNDLDRRDVYIGDDEFWYSPIEAAARYGHAEIVKLLLAAGSEIHRSVSLAADRGHAEVVRVLIDEVPETYNWTRRLWTAVNYGHAEVVKVLIAAGADPNVKNNDGQTLLHRGVRNAESVNALIAGGADPNAKNKDGRTPLHYWSSADIVNALIAGGADPNVKDNYGKTPLYRRLIEIDHCDRSQGWRALITGGADPNATDPDGITTLHHISSVYNCRCLKDLLDLGADPNVKDNYGNTPLHYFAMNGGTYGGCGGDQNYVRIMFGAGADLNAKNNDGKRPRRLAMEAKAHFTAEILKDAGAKK